MGFWFTWRKSNPFRKCQSDFIIYECCCKKRWIFSTYSFWFISSFLLTYAMNNLLVSLFIFNDVLIYSIIQFHSGNVNQVNIMNFIICASLCFWLTLGGWMGVTLGLSLTFFVQIKFNTSFCPNLSNKRATNESQSFWKVQLLIPFKHKFLPEQLDKRWFKFCYYSDVNSMPPHHLALVRPSAP